MKELKLLRQIARHRDMNYPVSNSFCIVTIANFIQRATVTKRPKLFSNDAETRGICIGAWSVVHIRIVDLQ